MACTLVPEVTVESLYNCSFVGSINILAWKLLSKVSCVYIRVILYYVAIFGHCSCCRLCLLSLYYNVFGLRSVYSLIYIGLLCKQCMEYFFLYACLQLQLHMHMHVHNTHMHTHTHTRHTAGETSS